MQLPSHSVACAGLLACTLFVSPANAALPQEPQPSRPQDPPQPEIPAAGAPGTTPPQAEQAPVRVLVTAQKWGEESVQDVPRSVTPIGQRLIRDAGLTSIEDAARFVPNTLVTGFTARRLSFPFVRGVGSGQGDPAVATFVDDVPQLSISSTNLSLVGLDRIEVLRGPSGALWGRNTIGGAINLITRQPSMRPGAELGGTFGNFGSQRYDVRATGPLVEDKLAVSVSGSFERRDGYTTNAATGNDIDSRESTFLRAQLLWAPDDDTTVRFVLYGEGSRDGGFVLTDLARLRADAFRIDQDFEGATNRDILAGSLIWNEFRDDVQFTSITSAQGWQIDESADFDFSSIDGVRRFTDEEQDYVYQELRLESVADAAVEAGKAAGIKWLVGASGFYSDETRAATNEFRPGGAGILFPPTNVGSDTATGDFESWAIGVYGQMSLMFGDGWQATAAVRYDYEQKDADIDRTFTPPGFPPITQAATQQEQSFERILPRASLSYRVDRNVNTYVSAARGFKAGGFNLTAPTGRESFGTETSWTYELGAKTQWFDDRLTANAAIFVIEWDDMQLSQFDATAGGYVTNAGRSSSHGVELELQGQVTDELSVFGTAGYLETEFDQYVDQFGQNVAGRNLPFAPAYTFGAGSQYTHRINDDVAGFARIDYFHVGEFFYDAGNLGKERYSLTNLRIGFSRKNVRIEGFLANAFDEQYVSIAFQANPGDPTQFVGANGAPRTWGLSMRVTF